MIAVLVEGIIALVIGIIEAVAGLFTAGAEAMGAGEALAVLFLIIIEVVMWFFLFIFELIISLIKWRKPRKVKKPIIWRKKKAKKEEIEEPL